MSDGLLILTPCPTLQYKKEQCDVYQFRRHFNLIGHKKINQFECAVCSLHLTVGREYPRDNEVHVDCTLPNLTSLIERMPHGHALCLHQCHETCLLTPNVNALQCKPHAAVFKAP